MNKGGGGGAVTNWTSMDTVFPSGMVAFQDSIKLPMIMHNRQWSKISDYIKHWSNQKDMGWYIGPKFAIPQNPEKFFNKFFTQQVGWGLTMYEQDWMCTQVRLDHNVINVQFIPSYSLFFRESLRLTPLFVVMSFSLINFANPTF